MTTFTYRSNSKYLFSVAGSLVSDEMSLSRLLPHTLHAKYFAAMQDRSGQVGISKAACLGYQGILTVISLSISQ